MKSIQKYASKYLNKNVLLKLIYNIVKTYYDLKTNSYGDRLFRCHNAML